MKSMRPPLAAIFFMTYFHGHAPPAPLDPLLNKRLICVVSPHNLMDLWTYRMLFTILNKSMADPKTEQDEAFGGHIFLGLFLQVP